jgi:hypothetical protein
MPKLYDHNGHVLQIIRYKESMGFVPTLVAIEEEIEISEIDIISTDVYGYAMIDVEEYWPIESDPV